MTKMHPSVIFGSQILLLWMASAQAWTMPQHPPRISTALRATSSSSSDSDEKDPVQTARLRLEMHWNLEESKEDCLVEDPSTCGSEECAECSGTGTITCRFCRGTHQLYINGKFGECPVCTKGVEICHSCKGTGWIAEWTQLGKQQEDEETNLRP